MEGERKSRGYILNPQGLRELFDRLKEEYKILAPKLKDGLIALSEVQNLDELPFGYRNIEAPAFARLKGQKDTLPIHTPTTPLRAFYIHQSLCLSR